MPRLTQAQAHDVLKYNQEQIYHLPERYVAISYYLQRNTRKTLLSILGYLKDKQIIIDKGRYTFFMSNSRLTNDVRKKIYTGSSSSRYLNLLCALGFFKKLKIETKVNDNFKAKNPDVWRNINVFSYSKWTPQKLDQIEARAEQLKAAGVRIGNISYNYLMINRLPEVAKETFPENNVLAPERKAREFQIMHQCIDMLIETQGYATRQQIEDNVIGADITRQELEKLLKIFKEDLGLLYNFKRPTKIQMDLYKLESKKYIYTKKE